MEFRKLRLSGFKSFVEPSELRIEPGLTGVVGPNGCGKSNLLEAIRWVMGENSPKSMRSGGMEDVIFAGTSTRPPRDFAEVVLHAVDDGGEDLDVTRRIERGAGSAYRMNGSDVRAKDVSLIFADAATGAHSPALVSQGKIAQVIAAKPTERRMMLEEAAGIAGLHVRRRDAELKLRSTEKNLERLEDLMAGLDTQMNSLRRQAKQAERYKKLSDEIRIAEARLLFARWRDAAAAAEAARSQAKAADDKVTGAQAVAKEAQKAQAALAEKLAELRDELADRRDDTSAHGHRMAALASQLEAAQQRLSDLDRQKERLEEDKFEADRMTQDAAKALKDLEAALGAGETALQADEAKRPDLVEKVEDSERAGRNAELALAKATADHAGVEADWRVAQSEIAQAEARLARLAGEAQRIAAQREDLTGARDPQEALAEAREAATAATALVTLRQKELESDRTAKESITQARDDAREAFASAKAELAGTEREYAALERDRAARAKQQANRSGRALPIDQVRAAPGYERALAAALGRDAKSPLGTPEGEGRFWTGRAAPAPVADSLANHITNCPEELAARMALVHVADADDGRTLEPGHWIVTRAGALRRWDGFVAHGEGGAEAARLEAENRFAELAEKLPALQSRMRDTEAQVAETQDRYARLQQAIIERDRSIAQAIEAERAALRSVDQAEAAVAQMASRLEQIEAATAELSGQQEAATADLDTAKARLAELPDPETGRASLDAARARHEAARESLQAATASLAAHDQSLAVLRERVATQRADMQGWQARAGDAANRLAGMSARFEEIEEERAVVAAKPEGLMREIESGEAVRKRLGEELATAEAAVRETEAQAREADAALGDLTEALAAAREQRATLATRAENEEQRREEMARISGERFQCPPSLLPGRFEFDEEEVKNSGLESDDMDRLVASRERIGPVNLVAADELEKMESEHGSSAAEQAELAEAVNRLRGSIGNLNREGRERLKAAFEEVDGHFRRLFTRLFEGGQAHLALVDSDDPLEAGLEIYAQPPGKRLQSLSLLSGGEQALTATALIFALFLTNPAPICVLDEVDAPLDDANIERFCDLLDSMVREANTRYLIVTHNAVTMSRMHRLFGVTMVEKGISRLVSVDLGEAAALAAE
ncbi:AAA family ATPase [Aurantiacibacter marinus]|uniref:Chromosome partition protein Smc n=1 Tax=Aurantiacibacter marinus TaxID=874156 RepID=A0A0H0XUR8_9SPHN|nr:AAA family ATPase [Aurantiacibacter marinus]KLI64040.1 chromosome segregation protein [Aurantiacibacter marinus]